ncbi:MAG: putative lipid II flippase FtsW [Acidobacteriota bacterium]|jgi:cell division protein FtsW|nr:putative lipid II flippase FtsW [Acidobacteriota bacterium]
MAYKPTGDKILFVTTAFLTIFGLVMVYSASSVVASSQHGMSSYFFLKQLAFAGFGFLSLIILMNIDYRFWQRPKVLRALLILTAISLLFVLTQPTVNGAHRWVRCGFASFQPSEIAKLVVLLYIASYLQKHEYEINQPIRRLLPFGLVVGLFALLIAIEPDLGQALTLCMIAGILLYIAGLSWHYIAGAAVLAVPVFYFFVLRVPFRLERIKAFLNPFHDPLGSGWQISQSLTAVGSGGLTGLGLGASKQKLFFLPEASSDFIFAVIGEELGLIGTSLVAIAFLIFFYRGIRIILRSQDRFGFYLGLGITLMVVLQGFINISMVLAMMPTKGIALPFISQGGSSILLNLIAAGMLLNLSHYSRPAEETE